MLGPLCCAGFSRCGVKPSPCGGLSGCAAQALEHVGFSRLWGLGSAVTVPGPQTTGSVVVARELSCSTAMWDLPGPGIEAASPALAGRFLTTAPPGKPCFALFWITAIFVFPDPVVKVRSYISTLPLLCIPCIISLILPTLKGLVTPWPGLTREKAIYVNSRRKERIYAFLNNFIHSGSAGPLMLCEGFL